MAFTQLPPLSLYIHIPWCEKKCPYCDFNSHRSDGDIPQQQYVDRLIEDLEAELPLVWGRQLHSIFIGGGTPSLFSPKMLDQLLGRIRALLPFNSDMEITLEANPGSIEANKFKGFFETGINRISIGVQSFENDFLQKLGRIHSAQEAIDAFAIARQAGFNNINLDLMYALPGQSIDQALQDVRQAIQFSPEHISWYQLTLEPNTYFYRYPPKLPDEDHIAGMSDAGIALLKEHGYQQYEVSAYSRGSQLQSKHNLNYWQFGDYLGIGAGAHAKITRADTQTITRITKRKIPKDYLDKTKPLTAKKTVLTADEIPLEFMLNALRLKQGFQENLFFKHTGIEIFQIADALKKAQQANLILRKNQQIKTTSRGYQFLNQTLDFFTPDKFKHLLQENANFIKLI